MDDWYKITRKDIISFGGSSMLQKYSSLYECLNTSMYILYFIRNLAKKKILAYPEHNWKFSKFVDRVPKNFWNDKSNHKLFLDYFAKENNIKSVSDWYNITRKDIIEGGGKILLSKYVSIFDCLTSCM